MRVRTVPDLVTVAGPIAKAGSAVSAIAPVAVARGRRRSGRGGTGSCGTWVLLGLAVHRGHEPAERPGSGGWLTECLRALRARMSPIPLGVPAAAQHVRRSTAAAVDQRPSPSAGGAHLQEPPRTRTVPADQGPFSPGVAGEGFEPS